MKARVHIDERALCKAMLDFDNLDLSKLDDLMEDWEWTGRVAVAHHAIFREAKGDILHDIPDDECSIDDSYLKIKERLKEMMKRYGRDSMTFNTLVRSVSIARLTNRQVTEIYKNSKGVPPAFDPNKPAEDNAFRRKLRHDFFHWLEVTNDPDINMMKSMFKKTTLKYKDKKKEIITLNNGTTTSIQWRGHNIPDIIGIVFKPKGWDGREYSEIVDFFGIANYFSDDDGFIYIELEDGSVYGPNIGGEHINVPDKDGKIREVYRMYVWVQVLSKAIHKFLDAVARKIPGNYTYSHRSWIDNLLKQGWNQTKYILGTDMEKYSDTLNRSYMMRIMKILGMPAKVVDEMYKLYGLDISDPVKLTTYRNCLSSYQGQYGDFPLITIVNLCVQCFVYNRLNERKKDGYNAAVGDDTGFVFDSYNKRATDIVVDCYGMMGVNINLSKTGELINGKGRFDFVKLEVNGNGVVNFLNRRNIATKNIDAFVKDVLSLHGASDAQKTRFLSIVFNQPAAERIMNLSIINGGLSDHPINEMDLKIYIGRQKITREVLGYDPDEMKAILDTIKDYLTNEYDPLEPHYLCETALVEYLDQSDLNDQNKSLDQLDEKIIMNIMNMNLMGKPIGMIQHYRRWIGIRPSELKAEWEKNSRDTTKNIEYSDFWEEISAYDSMAIQKRRDKNKPINTHLFIPVIDGTITQYENLPIPDELFVGGISVEDIPSYNDALFINKSKSAWSRVYNRISDLATLIHNSYFGNEYVYLKFDDSISKEMYRLYSVVTSSKYNYIPDDLFETYLKPRLGNAVSTIYEFNKIYENYMLALYKEQRIRRISLN